MGMPRTWPVKSAQGIIMTLAIMPKVKSQEFRTG